MTALVRCGLGSVRAGALALLAIATLALPAFAEVVSSRVSNQTTVRADRAWLPEAKRLAAEVAPVLARAAIDFELAPTELPHLTLQVAWDAKDLAAWAPEGRGAPPWAVGVAYPGTGVVSVALTREGKPLDAAATVRHEVAHIVLAAAVPNAPRWLHEGYAQEVAREWSFDNWQMLANMGWAGNLQPPPELDALLASDEHRVGRAYVQAADWARYLARRGRWSDTADDGNRVAWMRFLRASRTVDVDAAAQQAFGVPLLELWRQWRDDVQTRTIFGPVTLVAGVFWLLVSIGMVFAFVRQRRKNRRRLAEWERARLADEYLLAVEASAAGAAPARSREP